MDKNVQLLLLAVAAGGVAYLAFRQSQSQPVPVAAPPVPVAQADAGSEIDPWLGLLRNVYTTIKQEG